ncbi:hypothetical protein [Streptosporangium sp. KLBMP 9127]|nr:hypothetical protein [Streptosporangium sp. KLBMP 9127]
MWERRPAAAGEWEPEGEAGHRAERAGAAGEESGEESEELKLTWVDLRSAMPREEPPEPEPRWGDLYGPEREPAPDEPVHRVGRPPGGRPTRPDRLVAQGPAREPAQGGRYERGSDPPSAMRRSSPTRRRRSGRGLATPLLVVVVLVATVGAGVLVWQWVAGPVTTGLMLADGAGESGDNAFAVPGGGAGSSQVLNAVHSAGDTIVAVGSDTTSPVPRPLFLMSKNNGETWQLGNVTGQGGYESGPSTVGRVAGGDGRWLAVGDTTGGAPRGLWTSPDGFSWAAAPARSLAAFRGGDRIMDIARTKSGFVAVGSTVLGDGSAGPIAWVSPDGRSWTRVESRDIGTPDKVRAIKTVVARGDAVVALADPSEGASTSVILRSPDGGRDWLRTGAALPDVAPRPGALAVAADGFVLVPTRQRSNAGDVLVYCSPEGGEWARCGSIKGLPRASTGVSGLASSAAGVAAVVETGWEKYAVYTSENGRKWGRSADLGAVSGTLRALTISDAGTLVVGGDKRAAEVDNELVLMTAPKGSAARPVPLGEIEGLTRIARETSRLAASKGTYVAVGAAAGEAGIWTSRDGQSWTAAGPASMLGGPRQQSLGDVVHGRKGWLAVGGTMSNASATEPMLVTSEDGASWRRVPATDQLSPAGDDYFLVPHAVAAGESGYVIAGERRSPSGTVPALWFTPDTKRYNRSAKLPAGGAGVRIHDVSATAGGYVAVGGAGTAEHESGVVWVSEDGVNWTPRKRVTPPDATSAGLRHVVAVEDKIFAVGDARLDGGRRPFAAVSADNGVTWEYGWLPAEQAAAVEDLAASADGIVAVGWHGGGGEGDSATWTSENGVDWQRQGLNQAGLAGLGAQWLRAVAISGGDVVAVGRSTTYSADHLTLWRTNFHR